MDDQGKLLNRVAELVDKSYLRTAESTRLTLYADIRNTFFGRH